MRSVLWLSIFVFISTLFWPLLLDKYLLLIALLASFLLLLIPQLRLLAIIPFTALYFTCYANLTLTGQILPSAQQVNKDAIAIFVDGQDHSIIVQIVSLISENNHGYFHAKLIEFDSDHLNYAPLIEMRWYKPNVTLQAGEVHHFRVRFKPVYGRANPAGFDRQKWSYSEHIGLQATIKEHISVIDKEITLRAIFYQKVKFLTEHLTHQGLLLALSFADKSLIPFDKKEEIRNLGISHLFAISGLHIGLLFSLCYCICQVLCKYFLPASKMGWFSLRLINFVALVGAFGYAYLAGFAIPTQRAFLMLLVVVCLFSLKRQCSKVDLLLLVLVIVLIWDPLSVLSLSLWLSFSAVAIILGLLWAFPNIARRETSDLQKIGIKAETTHIKNIISYIRMLFLLQIGLSFLMLPVQLISFSAVSLVSILINLVAIPLFSLLIIPLVLLAALISLLYPPFALFLFVICDQILNCFFVVADFLGGHYQWFSVVEQKLGITLFALVLLLVVMHFQSDLQRKLSYLFATLVLCILSLEGRSEDEWFIDIIDVGQGLSVLVRSDEQALLYDTGARYPSGFNMVDSEIAPYLISEGINRLEYLVISHSDIDHAGGADRIADHMIIDKRWAGEPLDSQYYFQPCKQGQHWSIGKLQVAVLAPTNLTSNNNNNSCVLRISDGKTSLLLTGDIEQKQESILVNQLGEKLNSDILLAPHHGSRHSSSVAFIEMVDPKWCVFSAGFMNHWGFPAKEVVKRYQNQTVNMVNSGQSGLIRFQITTQAIKIQTFREDLAPYWYHHSLIP